jgi:His-Xaa-Ser repeat protein HxsA
MLKLQVMRVQIKLTSLGLYEGRIDGTRNAQTVEALKRFQLLKGIAPTGLMSTPTLNALGIAAVN